MPKKFLKIILPIVVAGYVLFCLSVYVCPQWFFYHPTSSRADLSKAFSADFPAKEVEYTSADGTKLYGWFVKPAAGQKIVVFFHGNAYNIESFYHKLIPFVRSGYGVFIGEYRGFGGINGKLGQDNLAADAVAAVDYLSALGSQNTDLILYGMSLGSYMAVNTAFERGRVEPFGALILEVPFDSVLNVVKQRFWPVFPFELLVRDHYDNMPKLAQLRLPVLIMGAENDDVVPVERAKTLFEAATEPKRIIIYSGAGHSNLYDSRNYQDILDWLKDNEKTE